MVIVVFCLFEMDWFLDFDLLNFEVMKVIVRDCYCYRYSSFFWLDRFRFGLMFDGLMIDLNRK